MELFIGIEISFENRKPKLKKKNRNAMTKSFFFPLGILVNVQTRVPSSM